MAAASPTSYSEPPPTYEQTVGPKSKCNKTVALAVVALVAFAALSALGPILHSCGQINSTAAIAMGASGGTAFLVTLIAIACRSCSLSCCLKSLMSKMMQKPEVDKAFTEALGKDGKKYYLAYIEAHKDAQSAREFADKISRNCTHEQIVEYNRCTTNFNSAQKQLSQELRKGNFSNLTEMLKPLGELLNNPDVQRLLKRDD